MGCMRTLYPYEYAEAERVFSVFRGSRNAKNAGGEDGDVPSIFAMPEVECPSEPWTQEGWDAEPWTWRDLFDEVCTATDDCDVGFEGMVYRWPSERNFVRIYGYRGALALAIAWMLELKEFIMVEEEELLEYEIPGGGERYHVSMYLEGEDRRRYRRLCCFRAFVQEYRREIKKHGTGPVKRRRGRCPPPARS